MTTFITSRIASVSSSPNGNVQSEDYDSGSHSPTVSNGDNSVCQGESFAHHCPQQNHFRKVNAQDEKDLRSFRATTELSRQDLFAKNYGVPFKKRASISHSLIGFTTEITTTTTTTVSLTALSAIENSNSRILPEIKKENGPSQGHWKKRSNNKSEMDSSHLKKMPEKEDSSEKESSSGDEDDEQRSHDSEEEDDEEDDEGDEAYTPRKTLSKNHRHSHQSPSNRKRVSISAPSLKKSKSVTPRKRRRVDRSNSTVRNGTRQEVKINDEDEEENEDNVVATDDNEGEEDSEAVVSDSSPSATSSSSKTKNLGRGRGRNVQQPGITCHQCKQKTVELKSSCKFCYLRYVKKSHDLTHPIADWESYSSHFCSTCLKNRYGQDVDFQQGNVLRDDWKCPICTDTCNCSSCRKRANKVPFSVTTREAQKKGYSSVHEMLIEENMQL